MSGGRFLVSLLEVTHSERIIATSSLLKENSREETIFPPTFVSKIEDMTIELGEASLSKETSDVATSIGGYITKKLTKRSKCGY